MAYHRDRRLAPLGLQLRRFRSGARSRCATSASGVLTAIGALFFAARLGTVGGDIGVGLEVTGADRDRARRHQPRRRQGLGHQGAGRHADRIARHQRADDDVGRGGFNRMVLAAILLVAAMIDIRWLKNRARIISKVYVSPTYHTVLPPPSTAADSGTPFAQNDKLRDVTLIGLGRIEGAGRRHSRSQRQSLRRLAPRRHHPLLRARLREDGGLRPYRRPAARHGVRPQRQSLCLHRRHGPLSHHARSQGREGDGRDQPQPLFGQRRQPPAARRRSRHRRRRAHFLLRSDRPLRDARMAGRRARGARQRPDHLLRSEHQQRRTRCCAD